MTILYTLMEFEIVRFNEIWNACGGKYREINLCAEYLELRKPKHGLKPP